MACDKQMRAVYCVDQCSFKSSNQGAVQQEAQADNAMLLLNWYHLMPLTLPSHAVTSGALSIRDHGHIAINSLVSISVSSLRM